MYYAVRGHEVEGFSDISKSHQISTEETFNYDLTDIFAIETALLKLCYTVRFRLLDENFHTKTLPFREAVCREQWNRQQREAFCPL